jgi:ParB family transcriptional regulator, chromosome partitioning protein
VPVSKNNSKHGLGRGFESLIPTDLLDESFDPTSSQDKQVSELRQIKLDQIVVDPNQPRKNFDDIDLAELAVSIEEHGVLQPIIVTPYKGGYQIVAGERRFRASKLAKIDKIPALVRTLDAQHKLEVSLIENLQRKDLNVMETATAYLKLRDQFNMTLEQIGKRVGDLSFSAVSNRLRLLKLPDFVKKHLIEGNLSEGQARPLIGLDEAILKKIIPTIVNEGWNSRKVEQYVVNIKKNFQNNNLSKKNKLKIQPYQQSLDRLASKFKTDIKIHTNTRGAGFITIKFKNEKEFERIQDLLD